MRSSSSELLLDRGASRRHHHRSRRRKHAEEEEEEDEIGGEEEDEEEEAKGHARVGRSPSRSRRVRPSEDPARGAVGECSGRDTESEERREALLGGPPGGSGGGGRRWEAWGDGEGIRRGVVDEAFGGRTEWSDEDSWGGRGFGAPGPGPGAFGRGALRGRADAKRKKKRRSWSQRFRFYLTAFLALALTVSASALLFLVPLYVDPAVSTLRADFRPQPAVCVTSRRVDRTGLANCSTSSGPSSPTSPSPPAASSCREGCTSDLYYCTQIFVLYSPASVYDEENNTESSTVGATSPFSTISDDPTVPPQIVATTARIPSSTSSKTTPANPNTTPATTTITTPTINAKASATTGATESSSTISAAVSLTTVGGGAVLTSPSTDWTTGPSTAASSPLPGPLVTSSSSEVAVQTESTSAVAETGSSLTKRERKRFERSARHHEEEEEEEEEDEEEEEEEEDDDDEDEDDDGLEEAVLLVNIKGCGYPPEVSCSSFLKQYGLKGSTFPCYYSRSNHSLVLAQYEPSRERARIVNMFVAPFAVAAASASALCFLHCECCRRSPRGRGVRGVRGGGGGGRLLLEGPGRRRGRVEHLSDVSISTANKALSPSSEAVSFYSRPL